MKLWKICHARRATLKGGNHLADQLLQPPMVVLLRIQHHRDFVFQERQPLVFMVLSVVSARD
jgi:hypothetical protein